jgi:hypothetical protein
LPKGVNTPILFKKNLVVERLVKRKKASLISIKANPKTIVIVMQFGFISPTFSGEFPGTSTGNFIL